eukprot:1344418-Amphidinium_carterae.1
MERQKKRRNKFLKGVLGSIADQDNSSFLSTVGSQCETTSKERLQRAVSELTASRERSRRAGSKSCG